jgi:hypothetical protein
LWSKSLKQNAFSVDFLTVQDDIPDIERRRKRMINELQAKRKAELEKKKQAIDAEQSKKREAQRFAVLEHVVEEFLFASSSNYVSEWWLGIPCIYYPIYFQTNLKRNGIDCSEIANGSVLRANCGSNLTVLRVRLR